MNLIKKFTRKKNAFFRLIKFNLINLRYRKKPPRKVLVPESIKKILLLRLDDKIGDMVVATGCAKALANHGYQVSILTGPCCKQILTGADYLHNIYLYRPRMPLDEIKNAQFDAVIDFDDVVSYERFNLLANLGTKNVIGFNKDSYKLFDYSIRFFDANKHITERYKAVLSLFNINHDNYDYHIPVDQQEYDKLRLILCDKPTDTRYVAINPFTGSEDKDFSRAQVIGLISALHEQAFPVTIIMIGQSEKIASLALENVISLENSTISSAVAIVRYCDLIITPDTSIVHIARALDKPLLAVYNKRKLKDTGLPGYKIWAPHYAKAQQIICDTDYISDMPIDALLPLIKGQLGHS
ncbi:lipopolysaccharide 1,2-N-acetylglucosaminetransferase [Cronobacter condimenti 1330]|uniref:Lipopolysaccharide 1,2-N-acetylglucosaminetransferase n=1 Tax=Cronobacter condimenti 1330 TaxID=1073999 RepID=A0ABM5VHD9_9ENTR|nr:glycosyltransferase family 9 protein [Cronobacter condimenti]ALB64580.1 lipopolysaccharide 1,2-N-acetylglucosaminetransferase [Cronobacter condimenti 1330]